MALCPLCLATVSCVDEAALTTHALSIIVVGASGDLAIKKTFPALFSLYCNNLLPPHLVIAGYARTAMSDEAFIAKISSKFNPKFAAKKAEFLSKLFYHAGQYDSADDFAALTKQLEERERKIGDGKAANRIFYFAIPPNVFIPTARSIRAASLSQSGWNRVIVEKPFGRDSESSAELGRDLGQLFTEQEIFRIDHYLGKVENNTHTTAHIPAPQRRPPCLSAAAHHEPAYYHSVWKRCYRHSRCSFHLPTSVCCWHHLRRNSRVLTLCVCAYVMLFVCVIVGDGAELDGTALQQQGI